MAIKSTEEIKKVGNNSIILGYIFDDKTPGDKHLIYEINKNKRIVEFYPNPRAAKYYFFDKITFQGFFNLPEVVRPNGYIKNRVLDYLNKAFKDKGIKSITIIRTGKSETIKRGKNRHIYISYKSLKRISDEIGSINFYHGRFKTQLVNKYLNSDFPSLVKIQSRQKPKDEIKRAIQSLSAQNVEDFEKEDISKLTDMLSAFMKSSFKSQITKSALFKSTKLKFDTVTLDEIINSFEQMLKKKTSEAEWGQFLESNLFLIDSKYIHAVPQLNVVLGSTRKVDFGLIDNQGYLDIFEIKKPDTTLLTSTKDSRGNYVWDKQALEAIVQAEKYLFHAEGKRTILREDLMRERQISLEVIRPRTFIIIGTSDQLGSKDKRDDFRILKNQFKNIEIILYDELLQRLKNQKKSLE
jgi:hypothetical protein